MSRFLILVLLAQFGQLAWAQSTSLSTDRGRVSIQSFRDPLGGAPLKVLRTDTNTPLRGPALFLFRDGSPDNNSVFDPQFYHEIKAAGLNSIRLACFEVWQESDDPKLHERYTDWNDPAQTQQSLSTLERVVNLASREGLYVIINAHTKFKTYPREYVESFWNHVAPFFKNRTHVLYELANEPMEGPEDCSDQLLQQLAELYGQVRANAPDTMLLMLTPSGVWGPSNRTDSLKTLADRFQGLVKGGVDWSKTAVAYHLYFNGHTSERIRLLHNAFPGFPSEVNFPYDGAALFGIKAGDTARSESMDVPSGNNSEFVVQTCEKFGLGWEHWHLETKEKFEKNFPLIAKDALVSGYSWSIDDTTH